MCIFAENVALLLLDFDRIKDRVFSAKGLEKGQELSIYIRLKTSYPVVSDMRK